jgi:excisionase family DNA binding protein
MMSVTDGQKYDELLAVLREIRTIVGTPPRIWLTPEQAADYLGVSRTRIYQYIRADRIPFRRLPDSNLVRLNVSELDEWVRIGGAGATKASDETIRRLLK